MAEGSHFNAVPQSAERAPQEVIIEKMQNTLNPVGWKLFEELQQSGLPYDEFQIKVNEFNELGLDQLDSQKLDGLEENLAEREMNSVPVTLGANKANISRNKRGVFTISA